MESSEVQVLLMKSKNILFGKEYWLKSKPTNTFRPMGDGILGSTGTSDEIQSRSFCKECRVMEIPTINRNLPVRLQMESSEVQVLLTKSKDNPFCKKYWLTGKPTYSF